MPAATRTASHHGGGDANCIGRELFLFSRERLEVAVHLLLVGGGRLVVDAGGETILRRLVVQLLRQRRFRCVERGGGLTLQLLPLREVLLPALGAGRGQR